MMFMFIEISYPSHVTIQNHNHMYTSKQVADATVYPMYTLVSYSHE